MKRPQTWRDEYNDPPEPPAPGSELWTSDGPAPTYLRNVVFCPACGAIYVGSSWYSRCYVENHELWPLTASDERYAAFLVGGRDAVRAMHGRGGSGLVPSDQTLAHQGACTCDICTLEKLGA